ncbi:SLATT domain-containing protein [Paraburkholderia bannensis]|uniref:SLATT domain-containing protein n=1 Tax=Paraburkholderia bannensis TaxID=765414 RepID=UPI002AB09F94|nr:SLATT domain-containing protein [Paraburkholderia bannensis]
MAHDSIWFTYKARIRAQVRLSKNDFHSQALLVWYAFCGAVLATLALRFPKVLGDDTDMLAAILSIALLVVSLMVTGRDFRGRSIEMRRNYLALESLYRKAKVVRSPLTPQQVEERYEQLLSEVENHTSLDDMCARVFHTGILYSRIPSFLESTTARGYVLLRMLILSFLYILPIGITLYVIVGRHKV